MKKWILGQVIILGFWVLLSSCGGAADKTETSDSTDYSDSVLVGDTVSYGVTLSRRSARRDYMDDADRLVASINEFGTEFYLSQRFARENFVVSPYNVSRSTAIASAGAQGQTLEEIIAAMNIQFSPEDLHEIFNDLDLTITNSDSADTQAPIQSFQCGWGQQGYSLSLDYYNQLSAFYGITMQSCDFVNAAYDAENTIDLWVNENSLNEFDTTAENLNDHARLVFMQLTSMDTAWEMPFDPQLTSASTFYLMNHNTISADFMARQGDFQFFDGDGLQAVDIPLNGYKQSMLLIQPDPDNFTVVEDQITVAKIYEIIALLETQQLLLKIPSFSIDTSRYLESDLEIAGIHDAFDKDVADFSKINENDELFLSQVKAITKTHVNEIGWSGESVTGVSIESPYDFIFYTPPGEGNGSTNFTITYDPINIPQQPTQATFDHPFIFVVRDLASGVILFMGRMMSPA